MVDDARTARVPHEFGGRYLRRTWKKHDYGHLLPGHAHLGDELEAFVSEGITVAEEHAFGQLAERCALVQPAERSSETAKRRKKSHEARSRPKGDDKCKIISRLLRMYIKTNLTEYLTTKVTNCLSDSRTDSNPCTRRSPRWSRW